MNVEGKLQSPEFENCTLPLTAMIRGKKVIIGRARMLLGGYVDATLDNPEVERFLKHGLNGQFSIKLNPEVRLEPRPTEDWIDASDDLIKE